MIDHCQHVADYYLELSRDLEGFPLARALRRYVAAFRAASRRCMFDELGRKIEAIKPFQMIL